ncbi:dihydrolipoyl dehydrogenase family protein [Nonlabens ponticola]|uniref:NAD(P)/FAD-dependent oxidoreductase n=1 Tax=Nonlabens ponticola TaxID=2496866 RepID=A0A3S9MVZ5_9FLAO|nr:NAD(P)/FAD-dependent oxidoreductase [Nonlabens ponticola]AZQ43396.1 NAD(P)/FAD-dependent oxidoreductase [Nonlabens ponticola]
MEQYDVFILGTGTAGKLVADRCCSHGMKVGIIDNREYGGTCSQRGCDPKKLMLASSEAYELATNMKGDGIAGEIRIDWKEVQDYARRYTSNIPENTEQMLKSKGVDCYHGDGHFEDAHTFTFDGTTIKSKKFVIATGMKPIELGIPGEEHLLESPDFFTLKELPEKVTFIGGGYIGMEFSHMLARAGVKVTVIEQGDQLLSPFEEFTAGFLLDASRDLGIDVILNAQVSSVEKKDDRLLLHYSKDSSQHQQTTDLAFNTAGREPSVKSLQLENAGVVTGRDGVMVDEYLCSTSQSNFYACGDVSSKNLPLTPLSGLEADVVAANLTGEKKKFKPVDIPSVTFTIPQVAGIGLTEKQAADQNLDITVHHQDASSWFNTRRLNAKYYAYKVIVDNKTDKILGAHIISHEAAETINIFAVAMNNDLTFTQIKRTIYTYPSWANDIKSF